MCVYVFYLEECYLKKLCTKINGLVGCMNVPGDKSISHRALLIGAMSYGDTIIKNLSHGKDCLTTIKVLKKLGVEIIESRNNVVVVGKGMNNFLPPKNPLAMGNSGTTARLMMGILSGAEFDTILTGDKSLSRRPMKRVSAPLKYFGGQIKLFKDDTLPAIINGQKLHNAEVYMDVVSAQVKSALIFAALQSEQESVIHEKLPTRNHTEILLNKFGAKIETSEDGRTIRVFPSLRLVGQFVDIPGDISSAAFFLVAGAIVKNSKLTLKEVGLNPTRTGILDVLKRMNAKISISMIERNEEPFGDITVETSNLKAITLDKDDIPNVIDELPLVALLAACAKGKSSISGAKELRFKESDRIVAIVKELKKLGVKVVEREDGMDIWGQENWNVNDNILSSHGDHRIGMMLAIAALKAQEEIYLVNEGIVSISYPNFFDDLMKIIV